MSAPRIGLIVLAVMLGACSSSSTTVDAADGGHDAAGGGADAASDGGSIDAAADGCALVTHSDGFGGTWQDCNPLGTYTQAEATQACALYAGDAGSCHYGSCTQTGDYGDGMICQMPNYNPCWTFAGVAVGHTTGTMTNGCPKTIDPMWQ